MITDVTHSLRISAAKRAAQAYMHGSRTTRPIVAQLFEQQVSKFLLESGHAFPPPTVTALRELTESMFRQGFEAGCRVGMSWK